MDLQAGGISEPAGKGPLLQAEVSASTTVSRPFKARTVRSSILKSAVNIAATSADEEQPSNAAVNAPVTPPDHRKTRRASIIPKKTAKAEVTPVPAEDAHTAISATADAAKPKRKRKVQASAATGDGETGISRTSSDAADPATKTPQQRSHAAADKSAEQSQHRKARKSSSTPKKAAKADATVASSDDTRPEGGADAAKPKRKRKPKATAAQETDETGAEAGPSDAEDLAKTESAGRKPRAKKEEWPPGPLYDPLTMRPPKCDTQKFHVISWNVAGLRALLKKEPNALSQLVEAEAPDVICLQEIKLQDSHLSDAETSTGLPGWHHHWHCSTVVKGYSGTAIISRSAPIGVVAGVGGECNDLEGRVLTAEYPDCFVVCVYTPNSGDGLKRLTYRTNVWDVAFAKYVNSLRQSKPVIMAGDFNCAHKEIDIANPKTNLRSAGFTEEERQSFTDVYTEDGWADVFRQQHPAPIVSYTYYSYRFQMRAKGKGWRLDYFLLSSQLADYVHDAYHLKHVTGSDHVPLGIILRDWTI